MSKISEQDALDQMQTLRILGEDEQAMQEVRGYGVDGFDEKNRPDTADSQTFDRLPRVRTGVHWEHRPEEPCDLWMNSAIRK
jgi:hypothetical protein